METTIKFLYSDHKEFQWQTQMNLLKSINKVATTNLETVLRQKIVQHRKKLDIGNDSVCFFVNPASGKCKSEKIRGDTFVP